MLIDLTLLSLASNTLQHREHCIVHTSCTSNNKQHLLHVFVELVCTPDTVHKMVPVYSVRNNMRAENNAFFGP